MSHSGHLVVYLLVVIKLHVLALYSRILMKPRIANSYNSRLISFMRCTNFDGYLRRTGL